MAEFRKRTVRVSNEGKVFELEIDDEPQNQISKIHDDEELDEEEPEQSFIELPDDNFLWTRKATLLLIKTRLDMDNEFVHPTVKKTKLWQRIANILTQSSFPVQGSKCDDKWRNLLQTYRKIKRRKDGRASGWQYFPVLDQAMKNRIEMYPLKNRKLVRLSEVINRKRTVESDCYSSDSCYSDPMNDMVTQREEIRSRPEIIRVHPDVNSRISREFQKKKILEANTGRNFHQPTRMFSSPSNAPIASRVHIENSARVQPVKAESAIRVQLEDSTPPWLNSVMHMLEERDKRAEARESERWNNLLALLESHREVEREKVKAINNLAEMLQQHFKQKSD